jgi:superfamily II DNA or RNA helicase
MCVIILDEVHHTFVGQKISDSIKSLLNFENVKIALGLSVTPTWKAKQLLQNILYSSTTERAMKEGILIKGLKIYSTQTKVNIDANLLSEWQFYRKLYKDIGLNEQYPMNEWQVAIYERAEKYAEKIIEVLKEEVGENSLKCSARQLQPV